MYTVKPIPFSEQRLSKAAFRRQNLSSGDRWFVFLPSIVAGIAAAIFLTPHVRPHIRTFLEGTYFGVKLETFAELLRHEGLNIFLGVASFLVLAFFLLKIVRMGQRSAHMESERNHLSQSRMNFEESSLSAAMRLSEDLNKTYERSSNTFRCVPEVVRLAEKYIDLAESEFIDNAYSPFWQAIENCLAKLGTVNRTTELLITESAHVKSALENRDHNFPAFPITKSDLPDLRPLVCRMDALVRKAQRDPHFAMIYEQRRTTKVLGEGLMNLQTALSRLGHDMNRSLDNLGAVLGNKLDSIADRMGDIVESLDGFRSDISDWQEGIVQMHQKAETVSRELLAATRNSGNELSDLNKQLASRDVKQSAYERASFEIQDRMHRGEDAKPRPILGASLPTHD
jgi:hypothetical protein